MKQLLLALVSVFLASSADATPIRYGFYQGGYDEGAFVAGYFVADNQNGDSFIRHITDEFDLKCANYGPSCELLDYFMRFSGNSRVPAFTHVGLDAFHLGEGADLDNFGGVFWDTRSSLLPSGEYVPDGCDPSIEPGCTSVPQEFMRSDNWVTNPSDSVHRSVWQAGEIQFGATNICNPYCGSIRHRGGGTDATTQFVHVFQVPEPGSLSLLGLALAGLAVIRRRK